MIHEHTDIFCLPAHGPYFLRLILEIPQEARKKAQNHPASTLSCLQTRQANQHTPITAAMFLQVHNACVMSSYPAKTCSPSLVPSLPDLFNVAREKKGSLVKLITCVTSGGTNFHIWHNSQLTKIKARDPESSSSSISTLQ